MYRIRRCWIAEVEGYGGEAEEKGVEPCMPEGEAFISAYKGACFPSFRVRSEYFVCCMSLNGKSR